MSKITEKTVKKLFALSGNRCAYPDCKIPLVQPTGTITGEICHIRARSKRGPRPDLKLNPADLDAFDNLILLCATHHTLVDKEENTYTSERLYSFKKAQEREGSIELSIEEAKRAVALFEKHVSINAKKVTLRTAPGTKIKIVRDAHPESVGADLDMASYIKHLIERYQECQKWDSDKQGRRKYMTIYSAIKGEFGSQWQDVQRSEFDSLSAYLQRRIRGTKLGRVTSHLLFTSFEDYLLKYRGKRN
ncbi:MAG: HNH endonuclease signature motif containing protein [Fimbriimonadaceae bacterium]